MADINLPESVRVLHVDYTIRTLPMAEMPEYDGLCENDLLRITICSDSPYQSQVETLWHEIKHAVNYQVGLKDRHKEEDFVTRGAKGELAVLRDNPCVLEIITEFCQV